MDRVEELKELPLHGQHLEAGAKITPYAGFAMPLQYEGVAQEHRHVREAVGVFDVSHMGEFFISGPQAKAFLQKTTVNDLEKLSPGKIQYSCMTYKNGGIVDDLLVYCLADDQYMVVVNAANIDKDRAWLEQNLSEDAVLLDRSNDYSLLAVQGPKATDALNGLCEKNLEEIPFYTFWQGTFAGIDNVIVSATGYTGAGGFELYVENDQAEKLWQAVMQAGASADIRPVGLGARDTLRLEMGFCLYGNDIDENTTPLEAGLGWITKLQTDFIGADRLRAQKEQGLSRRLNGLLMEDRGIPRQGYTVKNLEGQPIGKITSGTQSPSTKKSLALAYFEWGYHKSGTEVLVEIRNKNLKARVSKPPFYP